MQYLKYLVLPVVLGIFIISCEKDDTSVIDPVLNIPSIDSETFTPSSFGSDTINAVASVHVHSVDPVNQVSITLYNPDNVKDTVFYLRDDGIAPDVTAGDGIYSGRVLYKQDCRIVGTWRYEFIAVTDAGLSSGIISGNFTVSNANNLKPAVSRIYMPDSLQRPSGSNLRAAFLKVLVTDPNGICDNSSCYFNSFKPDGMPASGNPFFMYDDGNENPPHNDTVANDGKYSLLIIIDATAQLGNYTFKFNAKDRSGAVSDTLYHIINVYP